MESSSARAEIRAAETLADLAACAAITNVVEPFVRVTPEQLAKRTDGTFLLHRDGGYAFIAPSSFEHGLTAVLRSHRGRGIATALQRAEVAWASVHGFGELVTTTHELNAPMFSVKRKLGYVERAQTIEVRGELT